MALDEKFDRSIEVALIARVVDPRRSITMIFVPETDTPAKWICELIGRAGFALIIGGSFGIGPFALPGGGPLLCARGAG
jgi:hypothetical protein